MRDQQSRVGVAGNKYEIIQNPYIIPYLYHHTNHTISLSYHKDIRISEVQPLFHCRCTSICPLLIIHKNALSCHGVFFDTSCDVSFTLLVTGRDTRKEKLFVAFLVIVCGGENGEKHAQERQ